MSACANVGASGASAARIDAGVTRLGRCGMRSPPTITRSGFEGGGGAGGPIGSTTIAGPSSPDGSPDADFDEEVEEEKEAFDDARSRVHETSVKSSAKQAPARAIQDM